jgi:hypothetical protein
LLDYHRVFSPNVASWVLVFAAVAVVTALLCISLLGLTVYIVGGLAALTILMMTHRRDLGLALLSYRWVVSDDVAC